VGSDPIGPRRSRMTIVRNPDGCRIDGVAHARTRIVTPS
jgi:hypothetical protein